MREVEASLPAVRRRYRLLLRILPPSFRARHGDTMEAVFADLYVAARRRGGGAVWRLWRREAWDLLRTGLALRRGPGRAGARVRLRAVAAGARAAGDDLELAVRATLRQPRFFRLAVLTLALGVGAATAMYSVLKAVVLEPLPFPEPERLVVPWRVMGGDALIGLDGAEVEALRGLPSLFDAIEEYAASTLTLTGGAEAEQVPVMKITAGLPSLLGMQPVVGRSFTAEELEGTGARVLLLSHALWRERFGGARDAVGRTLPANGERWTIIGVMPRHAARPDGDPRRVDLWLPLGDGEWNRLPIARLAPGVTVAAAAARLDALVQAGGRAGWGGTVRPLLSAGPLHEHLRILMIAVVLLLLVACVNVSNLLLQRTAVRELETAVRSALGATRLRLARQFLCESLLLGLIGAACGAGVAYAGVRVLLAARPESLEALRHTRIDPGVLLFCIATALLAATAFGAVPALRGSRAAATATLGRSGRSIAGWGRFGWALVVGEIALSFALLIAASLTVATLRELAARDPGYAVDGLVAVDVRLPSWRYGELADRTAAFESMLEAVRAHAAVRSAALATGVPPRMPGRFGRLQLNEGPRDEAPTSFGGGDVDAHFFATLGQRVIAGRGFEEGDAASPLNPVVLGASTARRLFGSEPLGQRLSLEGEPARTVIGVVNDIHPGGLAEAAERPLAYWPLQQPRTRMTIVLRADPVTPQLLRDLRRIVRRTEPEAVMDVATVAELLGASIARERFTTWLLTVFAGLALVLAGVGLYGVLSQAVTTRTAEIGVRMALGASTTRIAELVLRTGMVATLGGLACGAALSAGGLTLLRSEVFGLAEPRPAAYTLAAVVLLAAACAAMVVPAVRAARVDPLRAIAAE